MFPLQVFPVLLLILQLGSARNLLEEERCPPVLEQLWKLPNATIFADLMLGIITEDPDNCALIPCTRIYKPVCSTLGNTYSNDCVAKSCGAKVASQGPCPKSSGGDTPAKPPLKFAEDPNNCAVKPCPRILAPVCSTGGNTYDNKCIAESCNATVDYPGACRTETGGVPAKRADGEPDCEERACPDNFNPVCSTDGRTYDNDCLMESCKGTKACDGPCPCGEDNAGTSAGEVPVAAICPTIYLPLCDTNNITHANDCVAAAAGATIACESECPCILPPGGGEVPVATACPLIELPVCGTNNFTYANDCLAKAAGATVACNNACPCEGVEPSVLPPVACPLNIAPVCGTDNNTYDNDCLAEAAGTLAACRGECPCPDLLRQLEQEGGLLIVPNDDVLLDQLARSNMTLDQFAADEQAVKLLLASLLVSPPYELDITTSGSTSISQGGQTLVYDDRDGNPVITMKDALLEFGVASITTQCNVTIVEVDSQAEGEEVEVEVDAIVLP